MFADYCYCVFASYVEYPHITSSALYEKPANLCKNKLEKSTGLTLMRFLYPLSIEMLIQSLVCTARHNMMYLLNVATLIAFELTTLRQL